MKNAFDDLINVLDTAEDGIYELKKKIIIETSQLEQRIKKKKLRKNSPEQNIQKLWENEKCIKRM